MILRSVPKKSDPRKRPRIGRFGPLVQITGETEEEKPQFAKLRPGQRLETITLEEALDLFKMPRNIGNYEEEDVTISIGRFGPYARHNGIFVSLAKTDDPYTIEIDRAIELIEAKRKTDRERIIRIFDERPDVKLLNGRWGPYLVANELNYKLPKDKDPNVLSLQDCLDIILAAGENGGKPKRSFGRKAAPVAAKKAPVKKTAVKKTAATTATKTSVVKTISKVPVKRTAAKTVAKVPVKAAAAKKVTARKKTK